MTKEGMERILRQGKIRIYVLEGLGAQHPHLDKGSTTPLCLDYNPGVKFELKEKGLHTDIKIGNQTHPCFFPWESIALAYPLIP